MSRESTLAKNTAVIALGKVCTQLVSFALLPLYTAYLSAAEFGISDLFATYLSLLLPLATLMIEQGAFRSLVTLKEDPSARKRILSSSFFIIAAANALFVVLSLLFFPFYGNVYKYYLIPILVTASFNSWCMQLARGFRRLTLYSLGSIITTGVTLLLNVLFIAVFSMGVRGMLTATALGSLCGAVFLYLKLDIHRDIRLKSADAGLSREMLSYSLPLIPNTLSYWILDSSDRVIVNYFLGDSANGVLAISRKFPQAVLNLYYIFNVAWTEMGIVHWNDEDRDAFMNRMIDMVFRMFSGVCLLLIGLLPLVFRLFVRSDDYYAAYPVIPVYAAAVLLCILSGLVGIVYTAEKRTKEIARTTVLAGIVNIAVHLTAIQKLGLYAAAASTFAAYLVIVIIRLIDIRKYLKLTVHRRFVLFLAGAFAVTGFCYYSVSAPVRWAGLAAAVLSAVYMNRSSLPKNFSSSIRHQQ